jgi:hypothetical protein
MLEGEKALQTAPIGDLKEMEIYIYETRNRSELAISINLLIIP